MAEYIEREALKNNLHCTKEGLFFCAGKTYIDFDVVSKAVLETPAADVVEVVRCKYCTMWERSRISCEGRARCLTGEGGTRYRGRNDFCSIGVKMDGDTNE